MKSLAGVAAKMSPLFVTRSPGPTTPAIGLLPALAIEPRAFSTTFAIPPDLFPGVGLALRSTPPLSRYRSYQSISRMRSRATASSQARAVIKESTSRTSLTSENITVAPARTSRSVANPTAGVRGDARECVAAAALHADDKCRRRLHSADSLIEPNKASLRQIHDGSHHIAEAVVLLVLHPNNIGTGSQDRQSVCWHQSRRLEF